MKKNFFHSNYNANLFFCSSFFIGVKHQIMGSNYNRCIRVAVLFLSSIVVYMQLVQHRATKGLTSLLIFLQISLFLVKVLIIKPIYTCFSEHVVTLAHLISIIHLHPPCCCFFFF